MSPNISLRYYIEHIQNIGLCWLGWILWTIIGYLMPNPVFTYVINVEKT